MAISIRRVLRSFSFDNLLKTLTSHQQRWNHASGTVIIDRVKSLGSTSPSGKGQFDTSAWEIVNSQTLGIAMESLLPSALMVLKTLTRNGYAAYLVGGCVRDLILKRTPKDFDVITTATLKQIKKQFHHCMIIGKRFPICWVYISGNVIEVSSFSNTARSGDKQEEFDLPQISNNYSKIVFTCWKNCMKRDFTINCLFFDPFKCKIYDFVGGIKDLRASKVRSVNPPHLSFKEDCAKILRGVRIAARLGFHFSMETETAIKELSSSILNLNKERLMMEMNFMMAHGAASSSVNLLKKFKLLDLLLPAHAAYLTSQSNNLSAQRSVMLMKLLNNADKMLRPDCPCSSNLWVGILAFHLALVDNPQESLVIWTFASILCNGSLNEAVTYVKESYKGHIHFVPEILQPSIVKSEELILRETSRLASMVKSSVKALTDATVLWQSLVKYSPLFSSECLVFVPPKTGKKVSELFDIIDVHINGNAKKEERGLLDAKRTLSSSDGKKAKRSIHYGLLKKGDLSETRFVLGKIILDTMKGDEPPALSHERRPAAGKQKKTDRLSSLFL